MDKKVCEYCGREETKKRKVIKVDGEFICKECLQDMEADYESANYDIGAR